MSNVKTFDPPARWPRADPRELELRPLVKDLIQHYAAVLWEAQQAQDADAIKAARFKMHVLMAFEELTKR